MNGLINKRTEYANKITAINTQLEIDIANYKAELNRQYSEMLAKYRADKTAEAKVKTDIYTQRIAVLDEMIAEEVPEANAIKDLVFNTKPVETKVEVVNTNEDFTIVNDVKEEPNTPISENIIYGDNIPENCAVVDIADTNVVVNKDTVEVVETTPIAETVACTLERPGMAQIVIPNRI